MKSTETVNFEVDILKIFPEFKPPAVTSTTPMNENYKKISFNLLGRMEEDYVTKFTHYCDQNVDKKFLYLFKDAKIT